MPKSSRDITALFLTKEQKAQIKSLMDTGEVEDAEEARQIVLAILNKAFGEDEST